MTSFHRRLIGWVTFLALAVALVPGTARADTTFFTAPGVIMPDENVLFNPTNSGLTVNAVTNQTNTPALFTTIEAGRQLSGTGSSGQARIEALDGQPYQGWEFTVPGSTFTELELNVNADADGQVRLTVQGLGISPPNNTIVVNVSAAGSNWISVQATNGQAITLARLETLPAGSNLIDDVRQIRVGNIEALPPSTIRIIKETNPNGGTGFDFTGSNGLGLFTLDDDQSIDFSNLSPGSFDITETGIPAGWVLDSVDCLTSPGTTFSNIAGGVNINLGLNGQAVCTFVNRLNSQVTGDIIIRKQADPADGTSFPFTGDLGNFSLQHNGQQLFAGLPAGDYKVFEQLPALWSLANVSCVAQEFPPLRTAGRPAARPRQVTDSFGTPIAGNGVEISLYPGEVITCTFFDIRRDTPTAARLLDFDATLRGPVVGLSWTTGPEAGVAGFHVHRAAHPEGPWARIHPELIPARGSAAAGAQYTLLDRPGPGTWFYRLEDLDLKGHSTQHPEVVSARIAGLFLPFTLAHRAP